MIIGPHNGKKVSDVKPVIRQEMLDAGLAIVYSEPEKEVMSRSGDECVVALTDQWYLLYGADAWREQVKHEEMTCNETSCQHVTP